jgi:hypothetical protein
MSDVAWIAGGVRLIKMMVELHRRGLQRLRIFPYEYPIAWRLQIAPSSAFSLKNGAYMVGSKAGGTEEAFEYATYSSADGLCYFQWDAVENFDSERLASEFTKRFPRLCEAGRGRDWEYAGWLSELSGRVSRTRQLPFVMAEYFEPEPDELMYLPLRDFIAGGVPFQFPLPPSVVPNNRAIVEERDELRQEVSELRTKIESAAAALR